MKPPPFDYYAPTTVSEALELLAEHEYDAAVLAGGQSLIPMLNIRLARPEVVIDINGIPELEQLEVSDAGVRIGATVRLGRIEHDRDLAQALPVLPVAATFVAHPQIRSRTTVGGTLCHADPAAEFPTLAVALGASLTLTSQARGDRQVDAEEFFRTVFTTSKEPDELLTSVWFPRVEGAVGTYDEIARRHGDFPFVGLCTLVQMTRGIVTMVRAAAAGVSSRPVRLTAMEQAMVGRQLNQSVLENAARAASDEVDPPSDTHATADYRRGLLRTLVRRLDATGSVVAR